MKNISHFNEVVCAFFFFSSLAPIQWNHFISTVETNAHTLDGSMQIAERNTPFKQLRILHVTSFI